MVVEESKHTTRATSIPYLFQNIKSGNETILLKLHNMISSFSPKLYMYEHDEKRWYNDTVNITHFRASLVLLALKSVNDGNDDEVNAENYDAPGAFK